MILAKWLIFIVVGQIIIYLWEQFPLPKRIEKIQSFKKLHECSLCSGVWIYFILAIFLEMDLLKLVAFTYVPVVSQFITGCVVSWIAHIFILGWKSKYEVIIV